MNEKSSRGLALICDLRGMILNVIRNDSRLPFAQPGQLFLRLIDNENRNLALSLLTEIKMTGVVLDWELNVNGATGMEAMSFAGNMVGDTLLIIASPSGGNTREIYEELLRINNEQTNLLRAAIKQSHSIAPPAMGEREYEEITRLNNELISIQREMTRTNVELARLNELKNQFMGMAVHDLRNPLQAIMNYSEAMIDMADTPARQRKFLNAMMEQSRFMRSLVEDLLDVAVIESGKAHLDLEALDLVDLVEKNLERQRMLAAHKHIEIELETESCPLLMLDRAKMEQVLDNLIGNAIKFSPENSTINTDLVVSGPDVILSVADHGPGISLEDLNKIFKPFERANIKTAAGVKSTGLGLTIVKSIITSHGGRIWVESEPGLGTVFHVALPFHPAG